MKALKRYTRYLIFSLFLFSYSVNAQISRTQIINNATPYTSFSWNANSCNLWNGIFCNGANIYSAPWVNIGNNVSMPYCWGGWSTQAEFNIAMLPGCKSAGQVCSGGGGGCSGLPSAPLTCAAGHDCSGFITRAWGLSTKYSTTTLPNISTPIPISSVQPGDILNIAGSHTRLVESNNIGSITVMEASGTDWKVAYHTYSPSLLSSYSPRCYNNVIGGCNTANVICNNDNCLGAVNLTSNSSCLNTLCSVDNATSDSFTIPSCDLYGGTILGAGVFFKFTPTTTALYTITVDPTGSLDAVIVVYSGNCFNLMEIPGGCMDTPGGAGATTTLSIPLNAGVLYTIRVYDYGASAPAIGSGGFDICITNSCVTPTNGSTTASPNPACIGNTINLSGNANGSITSWSWTGPNGFTSNSQNPSVNNIQANQAGTYTVTATNSCGSTSSSVNVTVNSQPTNGSATASSNPACIGNTVNLSGNANGSITSWSWTGPNGFTSNSQNPSVNNIQANQAGTYTVTATNSCGSTSSSVNVTVNSQPTNGSATASSNPACIGNTVNLSGNANGSITSWSWTGPNGFTSNSQNPSVNNIQANQAGTYTVTATNSCGSTSSSVNVTVNSQPTNGSATASSNPACIGNTVNLSGNANGSITSWSWTGPNGFTSNSQNPSVNNIQANQAGTYTVTATNSCGSTSSSVNVTVNSQPTNGSATASSNPACIGNTVNLSGNANGSITSWSWTGPNGFTSNSQNPSVNNIQANQAGTYTVTATNSCGSTSSSVNVTVNPQPTNGSATASSNPACIGNTVNLSGNANGSITSLELDWAKWFYF
ncbi:MAG: hypothetical protein IPJ86_06175 [Bacteroidetes bacterium]|nr:hypothetical protein [Bacteroidota bacterium]